MLRTADGRRLLRSKENNQRISVQPDQDIIIKPGHRVVLITQEEVDVPDDVLVRIISKGPVATYADPGFNGHLGIVTQNISDKYIVLPQGEPIAKAEFSKLRENVMRPYRGHHGFHTEIWPIKHHLQKSHAEVADDPRVETEKEEAYRLLPPAMASALRKIEKRQNLADGAIVVALFVNFAALMLVGTNWIDHVIGFGVSLVANLVMTGVVLYAKRK